MRMELTIIMAVGQLAFGAWPLGCTRQVGADGNRIVQRFDVHFQESAAHAGCNPVGADRRSRVVRAADHYTGVADKSVGDAEEIGVGRIRVHPSLAREGPDNVSLEPSDVARITLCCHALVGVAFGIDDVDTRDTERWKIVSQSSAHRTGTTQHHHTL